MKVVVLGAPADTGNLGVNALLYSVLAVLFERGARVVVADHGRGVRRRSARFAGSTESWACLGMVNTRRLYRSEALRTQRLAARVSPGLLAATRAVRDADVVLDISGGDSFTDIYGPDRFDTVVQQKRLVLDLGTPLVLLPQTYGPFRSPRARQAAASVVRAATVCASRDAASHRVLEDLLGGAADAARHLRGVDVAFALPVLDPGPREDPDTRAWLAGRDPDRPLAGVNVSGLITAHPERFDIAMDYPGAVEAGVRALVGRGADVLLVPHMAGARQGRENYEVRAARAVAERLRDLGTRVQLLTPMSDDPRHVKWWIGRCDWFTGPRMHATIAAVSQQVPTLATAYSMKVRGVFATAGQEHNVVDLATLDADGLVAAFVRSFSTREASRAELAAQVPALAERAHRQFDDMLAAAGVGR